MKTATHVFAALLCTLPSAAIAGDVFNVVLRVDGRSEQHLRKARADRQEYTLTLEAPPRVTVLSRALVADDLKFSDYETSAYKGPTRLPHFNGRDRAHRLFRTRLTDGLKQGPDFAGHYTVISIGCGMGKRSLYIGDNRTGQIFEFSDMCSGGEYKYELQASYYLKSRLIALRWVDYENDACWSE